MSLLALCDQLRQQPFSLLGAECALALHGFFVGYGHANAAIEEPLRRARARFADPGTLSVFHLAVLASPDARAGFHRALDALEHELRIAEPAPRDVRQGPPLVDWILDSIAHHRTGLYVVEPTSASLFDSLNGYRCGTAAVDPADAEDQRRTMQRFEGWLRAEYDDSPAPWHAILRIRSTRPQLETFRELYLAFRAVDRGA